MLCGGKIVGISQICEWISNRNTIKSDHTLVHLPAEINLVRALNIRYEILRLPGTWVESQQGWLSSWFCNAEKLNSNHFSLCDVDETLHITVLSAWHGNMQVGRQPRFQIHLILVLFLAGKKLQMQISCDYCFAQRLTELERIWKDHVVHLLVPKLHKHYSCHYCQMLV